MTVQPISYYGQCNAYAAQRFVDAVRAAEQTIRDFPEVACLATSCAYCEWRNSLIQWYIFQLALIVMF
ncbi:MAG: hypothetical protein NTAFB09_09310 [Nitrosospira sp.]